jgi:hypothetical protein
MDGKGQKIRQRHQQRHRYQMALNATDANLTLEEAILASLGQNQFNDSTFRNETDDDDNDDAHSCVSDNEEKGREDAIPHRVFVPSPTASSPPRQQQQEVKSTDIHPEDVSSSTYENDHIDTAATDDHNKEKSKSTNEDYYYNGIVDTQFLRQGIHWQRQQQQRHRHRTRIIVETVSEQQDMQQKKDGNDDVEEASVVVDVEDLNMIRTGKPSSKQPSNTTTAKRMGTTTKSTRTRTALVSSTSRTIPKDIPDAKLSTRDEQFKLGRKAQPPRHCAVPHTNVQVFHRVLDQVLTRKRREAVLESIRQHQGKNRTQSPISRKERRQSTKSEREIVRKEGKFVIIVGSIVVLAVALFWVGFGMYGMYVFFRPLDTFPVPPGASTKSPPMTSEIVIRVVKEIVHLDAEGRSLGKGPWENNARVADSSNSLGTAEEYNKVAQCIANFYNA